MHRGLNPVLVISLPEWTKTLQGYYWVIRVESKDHSKRRRYYRMIRKEKLRLIESGLCPELVNAACAYLVNLSIISGNRFVELELNGVKQLRLPFVY